MDLAAYVQSAWTGTRTDLMRRTRCSCWAGVYLIDELRFITRVSIRMYHSPITYHDSSVKNSCRIQVALSFIGSPQMTWVESSTDR